MPTSSDPSTTAEITVSDLMRATALPIRRAHDVTSRGITIPQAQAMARLVEHGPMTTADLARAEGVKPQSMGVTLAPLERQGLIDRRPHPTDGRQVLFRLTSKGKSVRKRNYEAKRTWLLGAVTNLTPAEQRTLSAAAALLRSIAEP